MVNEMATKIDFKNIWIKYKICLLRNKCLLHLLYRKDVNFMSVLSTGPFIVLKRTCSGKPITHLFLNFVNLSNRTLTAFLQIHQGFPTSLSPAQVFYSPLPISPLYTSPVPIRLTGSSVLLLAQQIAPATAPQVLIVTISGDVNLSGDLIEVSVTAGFSSDGSQTLDETEPTMFFRNQDFIPVSSFSNCEPKVTEETKETNFQIYKNIMKDIIDDH